jgi:hypothetical protein
MECQNIDWIHMAQNMIQLLDLLYVVMKIWVLKMVDISWLTQDRPKKLLPLGMSFWYFIYIYMYIYKTSFSFCMKNGTCNSNVGTLTWCYWDLLRVAFSAFFILEIALTDPKRILAVTWTRLCVEEPPLAPVYPEDRPCPWLLPPPKLCPWAYEHPLLLVASLVRQALQPSGILPTLQ